jgi:exosortase/archaeosortase family protein
MAKINAGVEILLRYGIAMAIAVLALAFPIFYIIFKPLTVFPVYFLLKAFYDVSLSGLENLTVNGVGISIIDACVAGSAYVLLFLLNALTRDIGFRKRIALFVFDSLCLLVLNIVRLVVLISLFVNGSAAFDFTHKLFWYGLSTVFVVAIWFFSVWMFKIKTIPFISDIRFLLQQKVKKS